LHAGAASISLINNPHEEGLSSFLEGEWSGGQPVPGSFFSAELFRSLSIDEWAINDPEVLSVYGGKSLLVQSHGQSYMSFFVNRFRIRGLYLLDEPENALSAITLFEFLELLADLSRLGESQFLIATHSPILMSLRGSEIFSFDKLPLAEIPYIETRHFKLYKAFFDKHAQP
jgi:predicted ATPase